jgi:hypothetical protein
MRRIALLPLALAFGVLAARDADAAPLRYETDGWVEPPVLTSYPYATPVRFEGAAGMLDAGSPFHLGTFLIDPPALGATIDFVDTSFALGIRTPELNLTIPPDGPDSIRTEIDNSLIIRGRINGRLSDSEPSFLSATFDSVDIGGIYYYTLDHIHEFAFPFPASDLSLPAGLTLVPPVGGWGLDGSPIRVEVATQVVPEPATALVLLAGAAAFGLRWRGRRSSR